MRCSLFLLRQCIRWPCSVPVGEQGRGTEAEQRFSLPANMSPSLVLPSRPRAVPCHPRPRRALLPAGRSDEHYACRVLFRQSKLAQEEPGSPVRLASSLCLPPSCVSWRCNASKTTATVYRLQEEKISFIHSRASKQTNRRGGGGGGGIIIIIIYQFITRIETHRLVSSPRKQIQINSQGYSQQQQPWSAAKKS